MDATSKSSADIIPLRIGINSPPTQNPRGWFRLYREVLDDPKVQRLDGDTFKGWINILCLASKNDGVLPCPADLAFALRITEQAAHDLLGALHDRNLLDEVVVRDAPASYSPHNWNGRQYKSDADLTAPARSKRYRDRKRDGVTRDETRDCYDQNQTRPDQTQRQIQIRTDSEQNQTLAGNLLPMVMAGGRKILPKTWEAVRKKLIFLGRLDGRQNGR